MPFTLVSLLFVVAASAAFFMLRVELRPYVLLAASWAYCLKYGGGACAMLVVVTGLVYLAGLGIGRAKKRGHDGAVTFAAASSIGLCALSLVVLKYVPHVVSGLDGGGAVSSIAIPVGFSYYIFQAISYLADLYRGRIEPEKNPVHFALYLSFFPKFVSGPLERADRFLPQVADLKKVRFWAGQRYTRALGFILYGYFLKLVIADRLGLYVDPLFAAPEKYGSLWLILGSLFYTVQIYCDFAGYTCIAIGVAGIFGIRLSRNFDSPYLAENIADFWHRWHMTLSGWLRDYLYIPLGGNRKGKLRKYGNLLVVFLVCGMWHGAGVKFLVWGLLHGIFMILDDVAAGKGHTFLRKGAPGRLWTFCLVSFAWIFFRASSIGAALRYIGRIFTAGFGPARFVQEAGALGFTALDGVILALSVSLLFWIDRLAAGLGKNGKAAGSGLPFLEIGFVQSGFVLFIMAFLVLLFGIYGMEYQAGQFIYMQF